MKKVLIPVTICGLILFGPASYGQDSITQKSQMLDVKLQLLDSKLELLDTKIKLWEAKPKELDIKLNEIDSKINSMEFKPQDMNKKLHEIDSLFKLSQNRIAISEANIPQTKEEADIPSIPEFLPLYKSSIMLDPARLLEGTFSLSYERVIDPRFSVNVTGMATYSTTQGLSNYYFKNQSFAYFDAVNNSYQSYAGEVMSGGGVNVQFRNYLRANHPGKKAAPLGLYAAPQLMYRKMKITGYFDEYEDIEGVRTLVNKEIVQHLNIFTGGAVLGYKISVLKVIAIDIFAGGNIRLSKYKNEKGFTKYKDWSNFDFSGVSPVAGIAIGILK